MDKLGERRLTETDIQKMNIRSFIMGRLSAGPTAFEEVETAATTHLRISVGAARAAIWDLANVGIIDGVLDRELSLATFGVQEISIEPEQLPTSQ